MCDSKDDIQKIKALVIFDVSNEKGNLTAPILCDAIRTAGIDIKHSLDDFWASATAYHIIHILWPEDVIGGDCDNPHIITQLEKRIAYLRQKGTRFIYTRHSECPQQANEIIRRVYEIIETQSDIVVHMSRYSLNDFLVKYPGSRNIIIPQILCEYTFNENISIERARQYLKLPQGAFIVTTCGKFSNKEERKMVAGAFRQWKEEKKLLVVPRFYPYSKTKKYGKNILKRWASRFGYYVLMPIINRLFYMRAGASDEPIDLCDLPYYVAASDVIIIPQKNNLNSNCIPMAFLFHKIIIGSNWKNVGEILRETGNPTFDPDQRGQILFALKEARQMSLWYKGENNYKYAIKHMKSEKIGQKYAQIYKQLINNQL